MADRPLVVVTWLDASDPPGDESWFDATDLDRFTDDKVIVRSVGWLWKKTKQYVTLVGDEIVAGTAAYGRPTKIPVGMIQSMQQLDNGQWVDVEC